MTGLARGLRTRAADQRREALASIANIFLGMTEAPLMVRPYIARMTRSELFCVMTVRALATVAGSVLVIYMGMVGAEFAGHLITASFMSAPAGHRLREASGARGSVNAGDTPSRGRRPSSVEHESRQLDRRHRRRRVGWAYAWRSTWARC